MLDNMIFLANGNGFLKQLAENLILFAKSLPTNIVIIAIVCVILYAAGKSVKTCVKIIIIYFAAGLLLGCVGLRMPNFAEIGVKVKEIWAELW